MHMEQKILGEVCPQELFEDTLITESCWVTPHLVSGVPGYRQRDLALLAGNYVLSEATRGEKL